MGSEQTFRGEKLLSTGAKFVRKPGLAARTLAPGFHKILDRIDAGLVTGSLLSHLPDGTTRLLGGRAPGHNCEVNLHSWNALVQLATNGSIGWYLAWEAGEWSSPDPVPVFASFNANANTLGNTARANGPWRLAARFAHWLNRNSREGSQRNIHVHYDLGNDFYAAWLDPTMSYSSAIFAEQDDLETAQTRKWDAMADRIGDARTVLEIGCGWGGLAGHLAQRGAQVTGISLSEEQLVYARQHHPGIEFRKQDYRDVAQQFDAITSVEMVEAVGREYWPSFFDCIAKTLKPGGRAAIQFISIRDDLFDVYASSADFIQAFIFPGGLLVRESEFRRLARSRGLDWQDQTDFGMDYARTLAIWRDNFDTALARSELPAGFDERFARLWRYYLMYCEGGFRGGGINVSQVTLVKRGN